MKAPVEFEDLGNLPNGWTWQPLQKLTAKPRQHVVDGPFGSNLKASEYVNKGVPIARLQNIDRNEFIHKNIRFITDDKAQQLARHEFKAGDILVTKLGDPLGKACIVPPLIGSGVIVADLVRVRADEQKVDRKYLTYAINSPAVIRQLKRHTKGTTRPRVNLGVIRELPIPVAPRDQQAPIVAEIEKQFSCLDQVGGNLKQLKGKLKRYRASVLKFFYSGGTMGEELPPGWKWTTIGEQFAVEVGATPSRKQSTYWSGQIPWVSSGEVQFGRIKQTAETITDEGHANSSTKLNPAGSVLLGMIGQGRTRGQAAILDIEAANNQNCAAIWVSKTETPPEFVYYWLMSQYEATRRVGSGNNQQAMNKSLVQRLPIPWPRSIADQRRLVERVEERLSVVDEMETQVRTNLARIERLRQIVLLRSFRSYSGAEEHGQGSNASQTRDSL